MAHPKTGYPNFYRHGRTLYDYVLQWKRTMINSWNITDPELTQLNNLGNDLEVIFGQNSTWPKYRQQP